MNDIHQVEVVVHVDEALSEEQRSGLVSNLQGHDGVEKQYSQQDVTILW